MLELLNATGAMLLAAAGVLLICAEFCLTGWVAPGVMGGVMAVCGMYRLGELGASVFSMSLLAAPLGAAAASGYGLLPPWVGLAAIAAAPWAAYALVPGAVHWAATLAWAIPAGTMFGLLDVAARAVASKTILD
jgi:hypothetical protein